MGGTPVWPGTSYPLGATYDGSGVNVAVFSEVAEAVEVLLLDPYAKAVEGEVRWDPAMHPAVIEHLVGLGITAVELLPVHQFVDEATGHAKSLMVFLNGDGLPDRTTRGERVVDTSFLLLLNAHHGPLTFTLPPASFGDAWALVVDTALDVPVDPPVLKPGDTIDLVDRSVVVLRRHDG